jgi:hypothetical protein
MANTQGSQGPESNSGLKSDRDRDMTKQSGSGQHSQQSGRQDNMNYDMNDARVGGRGGSTQQSGSGSGTRGQQPGSGATNPNPSKGNTGTSGGQYSGGSGGTGGNDR